MIARDQSSPRNGNGRLSALLSGSLNSDTPVNVTAFVDWTAQMHNAQAVEIEEPRARARLTSKKVARIIDTVLTSKAPSSRFRVALRLHHGWHKGFEATENRRPLPHWSWRRTSRICREVRTCASRRRSDMGTNFWQHSRKERTLDPRSISPIRGDSRTEARRARRRWSTPLWPRTFWTGLVTTHMNGCSSSPRTTT